MFQILCTDEKTALLQLVVWLLITAPPADLTSELLSDSALHTTALLISAHSLSLHLYLMSTCSSYLNSPAVFVHRSH